MYKINKTFDSMRTGMTHNLGDPPYPFNELTSSEIKYLVDNSFISPMVVDKVDKKQKAARRVDDEDSST